MFCTNLPYASTSLPAGEILHSNAEAKTDLSGTEDLPIWDQLSGWRQESFSWEPEHALSSYHSLPKESKGDSCC